MKLEDHICLNSFLELRTIADDSLIFLAILRGGNRGAKTFSRRGQLDPCPTPLATPLLVTARH